MAREPFQIDVELQGSNEAADGLEELRSKILSISEASRTLNNNIISLSTDIHSIGPSSKVGTDNLGKMDDNLRRVEGSAKQAGGALGNAEQNVRALSNSTSDATARMLAFERQMSAVRTVGVSLGAVAASGILATKSVLQLAGAFEQSQIGFTTMLDSSERAVELLGDLAAFAAKTPFSIPGVEKAAKQLLAVGFNAEEIIPVLKSVGDVAAGLGLREDGLERLILNLGQVKTQGKITGRELRDFAVNGVPILDELSKALKVSKTDVQELISDGAISSEIVIEAFRKMSSEGGKFANLMEKQSDSLLGLFSNLSDQLVRIGRDTGSVLLPEFKELSKMLIDLASKVRDFVGENKELVGTIAKVGLGATAFAALASPMILMVSVIPSFVAGLNAIAGAFVAIRAVGIAGIASSLIAFGSAALPIAAVGLAIGTVVVATRNLRESKAIMDEFAQSMGFTAQESEKLSDFMKRGFGTGQAEFDKSVSAIKQKVLELEQVSGKSVAGFSEHLQRIKFGEHFGTANLGNAIRDLQEFDSEVNNKILPAFADKFSTTISQVQEKANNISYAEAIQRARQFSDLSAQAVDGALKAMSRKSLEAGKIGQAVTELFAAGLREDQVLSEVIQSSEVLTVSFVKALEEGKAQTQLAAGEISKAAANEMIATAREKDTALRLAGNQLIKALESGSQDEALDAILRIGSISEEAATALIIGMKSKEQGLMVAGASLVRALEIGFGAEFNKFIGKINAIFGTLSKSFNSLSGGLGTKALGGFLPKPIQEIGSAFAGLGGQLSKVTSEMGGLSKAFFEVNDEVEKFKTGSGGSGKSKAEEMAKEQEKLAQSVEKTKLEYEDLADKVNFELSSLAEAHSTRVDQLREKITNLTDGLKDVGKELETLTTDFASKKASTFFDQKELVTDLQKEISDIEEEIKKRGLEMENEIKKKSSESRQTSTDVEQIEELKLKKDETIKILNEEKDEKIKLLNQEKTALEKFQAEFIEKQKEKLNALEDNKKSIIEQIAQIDESISKARNRKEKEGFIGDKEDLVASLTEQEGVIQDFVNNITAFQDALTEEDRRRALTEFERKIEDLAKEEELKKGQLEDKKSKLEEEKLALEAQAREEQVIFDGKKAALEDLKNTTASLNIEIVGSFQDAAKGSIDAVKGIIKQIDELERRLSKLKRGSGAAAAGVIDQTNAPANSFIGSPAIEQGSSSNVNTSTQNNSITIVQQPGQSAQDVVSELARQLQNLNNNAR